MKSFLKNHLNLILYFQIGSSALLILFSFLSIFFSDMRIGIVAGLVLPFAIINLIILIFICYWCIFLKNFSWQNVSSIIIIMFLGTASFIAISLSFVSSINIYGPGLLLLTIINIMTFFYLTIYFKTNLNILLTKDLYETN